MIGDRLNHLEKFFCSLLRHVSITSAFAHVVIVTANLGAEARKL
jgi:hypothetical protein